MVQLLLLDGEAPNWKDFYGRTPLWWAVFHGYSPIVLMLLESGANALEQDNNGLTPLSLAVKNKNTEIIRSFRSTNSLEAKALNRECKSWTNSSTPSVRLLRYGSPKNRVSLTMQTYIVDPSSLPRRLYISMRRHVSLRHSFYFPGFSISPGGDYTWVSITFP